MYNKEIVFSLLYFLGMYCYLSDSGPLMLSPTGQIIVPSSCPPFLLVNFITERMEEAGEKLALYKK